MTGTASSSSVVPFFLLCFLFSMFTPTETRAETKFTIDAALSHIDVSVDATFPDEDQVLLLFHDGTAQRYRLSTGRPVQGSQSQPGKTGWLAHFSADGTFAFESNEMGQVRLWQTASWQRLTPWLHLGASAATVRLARAGRLASASPEIPPAGSRNSPTTSISLRVHRPKTTRSSRGCGPRAGSAKSSMISICAGATRS